MTAALRVLSPLRPFGVLRRHRHLILQLARRDVLGRYRGSMLGIFWALVYPLFMLAVYSFVFGVIFQSRWPLAEAADRPGAFAAILFAGLIPHALLAEVLTRAPGLVAQQPNYVKKFVFPIEVLPWSLVAAAGFHALMSYAVLLGFYLVAFRDLHWGLLYAPLMLLPLALLMAGAAWLLAAVGVFLRDIGQLTAVLATALLFVSPVFFPLEAVPEVIRPYVIYSPLTVIIEEFRKAVLGTGLPDWRMLAAYTAVALVAAMVGLALFQKARRGFADVL